MGVPHAPAGDELLLEIRNIVAIDIFQENGFCTILDDGATLHRDDCRRNAHVLCENREFVGFSISIRIFANSYSVSTSPWLLKFIWVVDRFADPQATSVIPVHRDGLTTQASDPQVGFSFEGVFLACPKLCRKTFRSYIMLLRFDGWQWHLHAAHRFGLAVASTGLIIGNFFTDFGI